MPKTVAKAKGNGCKRKEEMNMRGLIITGGSIQDKFACEIIKSGGFELITAADSGMDFLYRNHITPDIIVGDFDSADSDSLDYYRQHSRVEFCRLNPEKDDTDTEFAIRDAISRGMTELTILGGTGNRIDHVLGNIALLGIGIETDVGIEILDEHNRIRMINQSMVISKKEQYGTFISLIPYSDQVKNLTLTGFRYNLTDYTMGGFNSLGISNKIVDDVAEIIFTDGILLVIESRD
jgi:thiamine pyrophosphokinase